MARRARSEQANDSVNSGGPDSPSGNVEPVVIEPRNVDAIADTNNGNDGSGAGEGQGNVKFNKDGSIRKKRGPNKAKANTSIPLDVNAIQFSLSGIHSLLAMAMFPRDDEKQKAFELTEREAAVLGENVAAVARHYDLATSQRSIDWFNLCMALATIEGPRMFLLVRSRPTKVAAPKTAPGPVSAGHFTGTRAPQNAHPVANGKMETRPPTADERSELLNETPLLTPMVSG